MNPRIIALSSAIVLTLAAAAAGQTVITYNPIDGSFVEEPYIAEEAGATPPVITYSPVVPPTVVQSPVTVWRPVMSPDGTVVYRLETQSPVTTYMPPVVTYRPIITAYPPPLIVTESPVIVSPKVYVPGQPIRNFFRAITP